MDCVMTIVMLKIISHVAGFFNTKIIYKIFSNPTFFRDNVNAG